MFELTIKSNFSSAHFLKGYEGKCKNLHGHNWNVEATIKGEELDEIGMVADFGVLKVKLESVLETMDHKCLNDLPFFKDCNTTTENIAKYLHGELSSVIAPLKVNKVQVWESDHSSVIYYEK